LGLRDAWVNIMRTLRPRTSRRLTARAAEHLLTGKPAGPDLRGLGRLLAAAAAPTRPGELAGERAAVEGFRRAYRRPAQRRRRMLAVALRRTVVVKAATGAVVLFVGGTALAAGTGSLPDPAQQSAHDLLGVPAPRHHEPGGRSDDGRPGGGPAGRPPSPSPASPGSPAGTVPSTPPASPDVAQLCRTYLAALAAHHEPDPAVRQQLAAAAGKPNKIVPYCTHLLGVAGPAGTVPTDNAPTDDATPGNGGGNGGNGNGGNGKAKRKSKGPPRKT